MFAIYHDKTSLFMPFDYEKHLIISVFSVECCLQKNNFRFFKAKKTIPKIEYDGS